MEKQFVTYSIAKKLKELGFNETCLAYYNSMPNDSNPCLIIEQETEVTKIVRAKGDILLIPAPLWQQAIDWLREKEIKIIESRIFGWDICVEYDGKYIPHSQHQTREAALLKALKLIQ